jgi:hypothetical protein
MKPEINHQLPGHTVLRMCLRLFSYGLLGIIVLCSLLFINVGDQASTVLDTLKPVLACWRLAAFSVLIGGWPYWVKHCSSWLTLTEGQQAMLAKDRWRFAIVLLLVELVLVQRGLLVLFFGA